MRCKHKPFILGIFYPTLTHAVRNSDPMTLHYPHRELKSCNIQAAAKGRSFPWLLNLFCIVLSFTVLTAPEHHKKLFYVCTDTLPGCNCNGSVLPFLSHQYSCWVSNLLQSTAPVWDAVGQQTEFTHPGAKATVKLNQLLNQIQVCWLTTTQPLTWLESGVVIQCRWLASKSNNWLIEWMCQSLWMDQKSAGWLYSCQVTDHIWTSNISQPSDKFTYKLTSLSDAVCWDLGVQVNIELVSIHKYPMAFILIKHL